MDEEERIASENLEYKISNYERGLTNLSEKERINILFSHPTQYYICNAHIPSSHKDWAKQMHMILQYEGTAYQHLYKIIRARRIKGRNINGPLELLLKNSGTLIKSKLQEQMILKLGEIEEVEYNIINLMDKTNIHLREKKQKKGILKGKLTKLYEAYTKLEQAYNKL